MFKSQARKIIEQLQAKIALRTAIGAALAWIVEMGATRLIGRTDTTISGLWCVISAIIILQSSLGAGYLEGTKQFLGLLIGSLMGASATHWLGSTPVHLSLSLFITVALMGGLKLQKSTKIASLSCAVIMILWSINPATSPWVFALYRFGDSCLGLIIGLFVSHFIFPSETVKKLKKNQRELFLEFSSLLIPLLPSGKDPSISFEEELSLQKARDLLTEDEQLVKEVHAEWIRDEEAKEGWELLHLGEKRILELLATSLHLSKRELHLLLDDSLSKTTNEALLTLKNAFENLGEREIPGDEPTKTLEKLKEEMARFRETRATRTFSLKDLEAYFVFYYNLAELLGETNTLGEVLATHTL